MSNEAPDFGESLRNPDLIAAAIALHDNRLSEAEPLLRQELKRDPFNVAAIRMMAELAGRIGRYTDAETLLRRAIELSPGFLSARSNLAMVLYKQNRLAEAIVALDDVLAIEPENVGSTNLKAATLSRTGDYEEAVALYQDVLKQLPDQPKIWMSFGHVLKTVGQQAESVAAYRRALSIAPNLGEVWWSLANLKTVRFDDDDVNQMERQLARDGISADDRFHLHFALGRAYEERKDAARSFPHYQLGNRLRSEMLDYNAEDTTRHVDAAVNLFTREFFESRSGGSDRGDPIFILGMPRAGSTLIEQILSSHSQVEGTMELPDIPALMRPFGGVEKWPSRLKALSAEERTQLGDEFLERTRIQRKTDKPFFIDKLPNNWMSIGFILMILPHAKIIDARRHPMDCCFSNFKQHFARGQAFSYSLSDMGHYYRDYVRLMDHFETIAPGRITRVVHEDLLEEPEGEIRRLLDALNLPFEDACVNFHTNDRAVRTASSEQVRRPINRDGADAWKPFEAWLEPLKQSLAG
jgi:tetratricopeptide (TPR) repeat protein